MRYSVFVSTWVIVAAALLAGCDDGEPAAAPTATPATSAVIIPTVGPSMPGVEDRATITGLLIEDLFPLQADFLGAIIRRDGTVSPCQATIPEVVDGLYEIAVMAQGEANGCGVDGSEIILWTYIGETKTYATEALPWPGDGATAEFDATFSTTAPQGAAPAVTEFSGEAFSEPGVSVPPGTPVEAIIGDTLCATGSTRYGDTFSGYILTVIADNSVPSCAPGATITFRIDGQPARETAVNTPDPNIRGGEFTLTQE